MYFTSESISIETRSYRSSDRSNKRNTNSTNKKEMHSEIQTSPFRCYAKGKYWQSPTTIWTSMLFLSSSLVLFAVDQMRIKCAARISWFALACQADAPHANAYVNLRVDERERENSGVSANKRIIERQPSSWSENERTLHHGPSLALSLVDMQGERAFRE